MWDILALDPFAVRIVLLCGWFTDARVDLTAPSGRMLSASNASASLLDMAEGLILTINGSNQIDPAFDAVSN